VKVERPSSRGSKTATQNAEHFAIAYSAQQQTFIIELIMSFRPRATPPAAAAGKMQLSTVQMVQYIARNICYIKISARERNVSTGVTSAVGHTMNDRQQVSK